MAIRTDLAAEIKETVGECKGVETENIDLNGVEIDRTHIINPLGAAKLGKPIGNYVTVSFSGFTPDDIEGDLHSAIKSELLSLIGEPQLIMVAGLGNKNITPDAFGPLTAESIFATRHIPKDTAGELGLKGLREVEVIMPGVLGQTGIEAAELLDAAVAKTKPDAVIVIDALAAGSLHRVGRTVQLCDSGICPGSGVGNQRKEISKRTLGVPVAAIGVPTVVDASAFAETETGKEYTDSLGGKMMVTPRDIDSMVQHAARTVSHAINCALQPQIPKNILLSLGY